MIPRVNEVVAFIANSLWIVPAKITRVYPDNKVDLQIINILHEVQRKVTGLGMSRKVEEYESYVQRNSTRLNVREVDPCSIIRKEAVPLDRVQSGGGLTQTHTDDWVEVAKSRLPRFQNISTSLVGGWFDPSRWNYRIYCQMYEFEDRELRQKFEAIETTLPSPTDSYDLFEDAFRIWFTESFTEDNLLYQQGIPHMWDRCEIQAVEKDSKDRSKEVNGVVEAYNDDMPLVTPLPSYEELLEMYKQDKAHEDNQLTEEYIPRAKAYSTAVGDSKRRKARSRKEVSRDRK